MKCSLHLPSVWAVACLLLHVPWTSALHAEDAGLLDFLVATTGHGLGGKLIHTGEDSVVTSDSAWSSSGPSSCMVASRKMEGGSLLWRRNVCSTAKDTPSHAVVSSGEFIFSNDATGSVRAWTMDEGALLWDTPPTLHPHQQPRVWAATTEGDAQSVVAATLSDEHTNDLLNVYNAVSGRSLGTVKASDVGGGSARWLYVMAHESKEGTLKALVAPVSEKDGQSVAPKATLVELTLNDDEVKVGASTKVSLDSPFLVSSLQLQRMGNKDFRAIALDEKSLQVVHFSLSSGESQAVDISQLHPLWNSMVSILPTPQAGVLRIVGRDNRYPTPRDSMALFRFAGSQTLKQWYATNGSEETQFDGIAHCPESELVVAVERGEVIAFDAKPGTEATALISVDVSGDTISLSKEDMVTGFEVLSCEANSVTTLLTTARGTTVVQTVSRNAEGSLTSRVVWSAEEGLSKVSDALLLDASHSASVLEALSEEEEAEAMRRLSFSSRLQSQMNDISSFVSSAGGGTESRDLDFGFVKVAMLLSNSAHRLWGMPTSGPSRGSISWMVDLPQTAEWHALVHGTASSTSIAHGINGGTHSPEVLVLSSLPDSKIEWTCLDGTTGGVHSSGSSSLSSPVVQVMPLFGGFGKCRQIAVLVHEDESISVIPDDNNGKGTVLEHIRSNKNGMYTHIVNRETNSINSFQIEEESSSFVPKLVGYTSFPGERIIEVAYPQRDEVVQAPCKTLGDDSLLLKYLNPHLALIMTVSDEEEGSDEDELSAALSSMSAGTGKRKPVGATKPGEDTSATEAQQSTEDAPNLFVNMVDTVSGRVLYRTGHSNASPAQHIPILISENWVIYAFFNEKNRRTEVGVLTLYEGMIDKNGLSAFSSPEQALSFSSLEARNAKPVVLTKRYVVPKPVTALGITSTRYVCTLCSALQRRDWVDPFISTACFIQESHANRLFFHLQRRYQYSTCALCHW